MLLLHSDFGKSHYNQPSLLQMASNNYLNIENS